MGIPLSSVPPTGSDRWVHDFHAIGPIGQYADNVLLLYRPDQWDRWHPRGGEADILVAKGSQFPTTFTVAHQLHLHRMLDLPTAAILTSESRTRRSGEDSEGR